MQLTRQPITEEIEHLRTRKGEDFDATTRGKSSIISKLKRLLPGGSTTLAAMQTESGEVTDKADEMAEALRVHWERVFQAPLVNLAEMREWLGSLRPPGSGEQDREEEVRPGDPLHRRRLPRKAVPREAWKWRVRRCDVEQAIRAAGNTPPGPDGIPFAAWRSIKGLWVSILLGVARQLERKDAPEVLQQACADESDTGTHGYNLGTLVCLPKAPTGEDPELGTYFRAADTRPLSIVNCDNRIVANSMRLRWEEHLCEFVRERQQGFLRSLSTLKGLLEVESAMMLRSLQDDSAAAVFLDFAAAFPSISQQYIHECLVHIGVPANAVNAFRSLYNECRCKVSVKGQTFAGFNMSSGVRQGCPLSPLIYAVAAELLLDAIEQRTPEAFVRAYADDAALVLQDFWKAAPGLANTFAVFERISGLRLNMAKSYVIPLNAATFDEFERRKADEVPGWAAMPVCSSCKYLGFQMGPAKAILRGTSRGRRTCAGWRCGTTNLWGSIGMRGSTTRSPCRHWGT